jgi:transketolase
VLSFPTVKPIDEQAVVDAATGTRGIVTVEEALVTGLGSAIAEVVVRRAPVRMRFVGMQDELAVTGSTQWLMTHYGIDADGIVAAARELLAP